MANIKTLLKEFDLPDKWKRIESPTIYNDEIIPFNKNPPNGSGGYYQNGNVIMRSADNSIRWISMTIYDGKHVKCFDARFNPDGKNKDFDINYFSTGEESSEACCR